MAQKDNPLIPLMTSLIPADCSINSTDPDTHKLYCFASTTSLVHFLDWPQTYLTAAQKNWRVLKGKRGEAR